MNYLSRKFQDLIYSKQKHCSPIYIHYSKAKLYKSYYKSRHHRPPHIISRPSARGCVRKLRSIIVCCTIIYQFAAVIRSNKSLSLITCAQLIISINENPLIVLNRTLAFCAASHRLERISWWFRNLRCNRKERMRVDDEKFYVSIFQD